MPSPDLIDALDRILVGSVSVTTRALADAVPGLELTFSQWRTLLILGEGDAARIGAIAMRVGVTQPATGRMLRRLERRGLVTMARDEVDRRAIRCQLTEEGRRVRAEILRARRIALQEIATAVDPPDHAPWRSLIDDLAAAFGRFA